MLAWRSARSYSIFGLWVFAIIFLVVGWWGALASLSGAVIARGIVVADTDSKKVQSPLGGVIADVKVRNGDLVSFGDLLVRLDDTLLRTNLAGIQKGLNELRIRRARLMAERDGFDTIVFPNEVLARSGDFQEILLNERRLFELRFNTRQGRKAQIEERIAQFGQEEEGISVQLESIIAQKVFINEELDGTRYLYTQQLVPLSRLSALEREAARLNGTQGQLIASMAQTKGKIVEARLAIHQIDADLFSEVGNEQREIDAKLAPLEEQLIAAQHQLSLLLITAPQDGIVHQLNVRTPGGVVAAGEVLMLIVPNSEPLVVEAQVSPTDIDQIKTGAPTNVRFVGYNQRTTPEINGLVSSVSPDVTVDQRTGGAYYTARIKFPDDQLKRLTDATVVPGMPVEAFIKTGDRRVIEILLKPVSDQLFRAYRQD